MNAKTHYVCSGGCGTISQNTGNCITDGCENKGGPLSECDCTDGKHYQIMGGGDESEGEKGMDE